MLKITVDKDGKLATLNTRASAKAISATRLLEGRRQWLKGGGLRFEASDHNITVLRSHLDAEVVAGDSHAEEFDVAAPTTTYAPRTAPMEHQARAIEKLRSVRHGALFMEQGTGKTWVAITRAGQLAAEGKITAMLVVTKKGVHRQWVVQQMPEHCGCNWLGNYWGPNRKMVSAGGSRALGPGNPVLEVFSINIDALRTKNGLDCCIEFVERHKGRVLMVVDESHQIKNKQSQRWKSCNHVGRLCSHRLVLTGTPIAVNLEDEWAQLSWLDESIIGIRYATSFRNRYCIMGGFNGRQIVAHKNIEDFKQTTSPFIFRATKDELGILPKLYTRWEFPVSADQRQRIKDIKSDSIDLLRALKDGRINAADSHIPPEAMAKVLGNVNLIQQISNGFYYDEDRKPVLLFKDVMSNPRAQAMVEILDSVDGPVVVWCRYHTDVTIVAHALAVSQISFTTYYGPVSDRDRAKAVECFMDGSRRVFVATPSAAGTGLNLQGSCRNAIYWANSDNAIDRWQSEDRIHRIGTKGSVQYFDLVASHGVDRAILNRLKGKRQFSQMVLDDIITELEEL